MSSILIVNPILYTAETNDIPKTASIKDAMIYTLGMGFVQNGHRVTLIAAADYRPVEEEQYDFEVIFLRTACRKLFLPRCLPYMPGLRSYLKAHAEYDLIITSEVFAPWSFTAVRLYPDKTVVWHELAGHNRMLHRLPSLFWYHIVARFLMRKAYVIPRSEAAGTFIAQFMRHVGGTAIDHGIDLERLDGFLETPAGTAPKKNQFAVVSQLIPRKRIDNTIEQFAAFYRDGHEDYRLYVIGDGEERERLQKQVQADRLTESVIFCGKLPHREMFPILAASKALLISTEKDNNMVSISESIAAGTPVVTTSVPYNAACVARKKLGIVADGWDASALERICSDNETYVKNCMSYRKKLSNRYCAEQFLRCPGDRTGRR